MIVLQPFPITVKECPVLLVCQILKQIVKYLLLVAQSKESTCNAGDLGSIPGSGRSSGEGNGYPLQYSCLENSMDRGAWRVQGAAKSRT